MNIPWRSAWLYCGGLILALVVLCLLPAFSWGVSGGAWSPIVGSIAQANPARLREEYPANRVEYDHDGRSLIARYWFKDKDRGGNEQQVPCELGEWENSDLKKGEGLELCPEVHLPPQAATRTELTACFNSSEGRIDWLGKAPAGIRYPYGNYMFRRGLRCHEGQWVLDYPSLILQSTPALQDCIWSLNRKVSGDPRLMMEFFLSMRYEEVDEIDQDLQKWTAGLRVPTSVMIRNGGDCDSKAAAFCAMQRKVDRLVIFRSVKLEDPSQRGHAFVGVEVEDSGPSYPLRDENEWVEGPIEPDYYDNLHPLEFPGRSYVPIDVTGPGDIKLGEIVWDKRGTYVAIPIPQGDAIQLPSDASCVHAPGDR